MVLEPDSAVMVLPPLLLLPLLWVGEWGRGERPSKWSPQRGSHHATTLKSLAQDLTYSMRLEQWVTVQEGQCVRVPCGVTYPFSGYAELSPVHRYWYKKSRVSWHEDILVATNNPAQQVQKETRSRFHLLGDLRAHSCSLDIRDARKEDAGTYYFRLERGAGVRHSYTDHPLSVTVTALTQVPHVQLPGTLQSGRPSTITCSAPWACTRGMPPTFSWTGVALPSQGTDSPVLSLTPGPQHHGTSLTCRVSFPGAGVSTEVTVQLSVDYAPENMTIQVIRKEGSEPAALGNSSALLVQEGQSLRLVCVVDSRPSASLSWVRGNLTLKSSASLSPEGAGGAGEHSQSLELELPSVHLDDHGPFLCRAQHPLGSQETSLHLSVQRSSGAGTGVIPGVVGGAGVTALLALCLVFFLVRSCRRRRAEGAVSRASPGAAGRIGSDSGGPLNGSGAAIPSGSPGPAARSPSEKEQELDYASLMFHKEKSRNLQAQKTTEYSEIKIRR